MNAFETPDALHFKRETTGDAAVAAEERRHKRKYNKRKAGECKDNPWAKRASGWKRTKEETFVSPYKTQPTKITTYFRVTREELSFEQLKAEAKTNTRKTLSLLGVEPISPIGPPPPLIRSVAEPHDTQDLSELKDNDSNLFT